MMTLTNALASFGGRKIEPTELSSYQRWAYAFFHSEHLQNPQLSTTLQLDLTEAVTRYGSDYRTADGASFTAFLLWKLLQSLKRFPDFQARHFEGNWYAFDNLPLYFPVAVGGDRRFMDVIMENVNGMDWPTFAASYRMHIGGNVDHRDKYAGSPMWHLFTFIGNLPALAFTSFNLHTASMFAGRPFFYFGKRQTQADGLVTAPLSVTFDHANTDPFILSQLIEDYMQELAN